MDPTPPEGFPATTPFVAVTLPGVEMFPFEASVAVADGVCTVVVPPPVTRAVLVRLPAPTTVTVPVPLPQPEQEETVNAPGTFIAPVLGLNVKLATVAGACEPDALAAVRIE